MLSVFYAVLLLLTEASIMVNGNLAAHGGNTPPYAGCRKTFPLTGHSTVTTRPWRPKILNLLLQYATVAIRYCMKYTYNLNKLVITFIECLFCLLAL